MCIYMFGANPKQERERVLNYRLQARASVADEPLNGEHVVQACCLGVSLAVDRL